MNRPTDDKTLSKTLSWLLRHSAVKEGISISQDGYVNVDELLRHRSLQYFTLQDVLRVVENNVKQRFTVCMHPVTGHLQIKANQGHSIQINDASLTPILNASDAPVVIHGTYFRNWEKIQEQGLSRMNRLHIHFTPGEHGESSVISGMRSSCQLYIYIDLEKALKDQLEFYRSANNVILSPGNAQGFIEPKYFAKVVQVSPRKILEYSTTQPH